MRETAAPPPPLRWVHHDDRLVVVDKPSGLLAVPGRGADKADCAASHVLERFADARVVHRLDQATSGLLVFARGIAVQRELGRRFESRRVLKTYVAVVAGAPDADAGTIDLPLAADWPNRPRQRVDPEHGRAACTHWRVIRRDDAGSRTRLELEPRSGRTHQLRVHLAAIGHPIVGDRLYAGAAVAEEASRLLLHASALDLGELDGAPARFDSAPPF